MMIAPGEPASEARSDPTDDIGPPASRMAALYAWRNGHSADTPDGSALCPFLDERRDQPRMPLAAVKHPDAIH